MLLPFRPGEEREVAWSESRFSPTLSLWRRPSREIPRRPRCGRRFLPWFDRAKAQPRPETPSFFSMEAISRSGASAGKWIRGA